MLGVDQSTYEEEGMIVKQPETTLIQPVTLTREIETWSWGTGQKVEVSPFSDVLRRNILQLLN
jgi:hypothetical protein